MYKQYVCIYICVFELDKYAGSRIHPLPYVRLIIKSYSGTGGQHSILCRIQGGRLRDLAACDMI